MESKRRVRDRMSSVLLILWTMTTALSGLNLDCTNDYDSSMRCHIEAQNCTEYSLTLRSNEGYGDNNCTFEQRDGGPCFCDNNNMTLVKGESHTAIVWKGGNRMGSKNIDIANTIKPKTPTIISVNESNGNFQVTWRTNYNNLKNFRDSLTSSLTYYIKGGTKEVPKLFPPTTIDNVNYHEILSQHLKSSTTYVVSVKSCIEGHVCSDSSIEKEFTTPMSPVILPLVIIISLSVAAVIITSAVYVCYVKLKTKWWDTVYKFPNPKLLINHSDEQEVLKPMQPPISTVSVEPFVPVDSKPWSKGSDTSSGSTQQSSGISTGSSCLSYANTEPIDIIAGVQDALGKAFANISPVSPLTTNAVAESYQDNVLLSSGVRADDMSSGCSDFDNKTYSIIIPSCPHLIPGYQPNADDTEPCVDRQAPACPSFPPVVLSPMPTEMPYQQCHADSEVFPYAEDSSLSSVVSSGSNTVASCDSVSGVEAERQSSDEAVRGATVPHGKTVADENPCYGCVPAGSHSLPPVDDDYQPFQNMVEQPDVLFSEERFDEKEEHLNKYPEELFTKMPQSFLSPIAPDFMDSVQGGQCLPELQRPFLSLIPADQPKPLITDSGYQCV